MTKPELGTKRICSCGARFCDLNKSPIVCPKCAAVFVPPAPVLARPRRVMYPPPAPAKKTAMPDVPAELVSLEETDDATERIEALTEGLDDKKGDGGFIVPEDQDEEEDATGIIGDDINKTRRLEVVSDLSDAFRRLIRLNACPRSRVQHPH